MSATHPTVTRVIWLAEYIELLKAEKELTRRSGELACRRQALPWVHIDKSHCLETENGSVSLANLSGGRLQLLVYHLMFGPDYKAGCPSCSMITGGLNGFVAYLANHDVTLVAVSRGSLAKLLEYRERMSWSFPWVLSVGSNLDYDFNALITGDQQHAGGAGYNCVRGSYVMDTSDLPEPVQQSASTCGTDVSTYVHDRPGMSAFMLENGVMYHTYSTYAYELDGLWGAYQWLDRAPLGRNEVCVWWRRHDKYARQR